MSSLNDLKYAKMTAAGLNGAMGEMELGYVTKILAEPDLVGEYTIQDAWHAYWDQQSVAAGAYGDRAYAWLATQGHTQEALNDRWYAYWGAP